MFLVKVPLELLLISLIVILIAIIIIFVNYLNIKRKNTFKSRIMYLLMKEKMEDIHQSNDKVYDISFRNNTKRFYIKIHNGGSKKGFVMTNPLTIYEHIYPSKYGSSKKNYVLTKLKPFLSEKLEGIKIILVKDNLLRITKYINENEIEEVKYNEPSFNTYIVQEKEFNSFLDLLSKKKK